MPKALRPIGHDDRLSIVDHLDELRSRLIAAGVFVVAAFAVCFWQNHALLDIVNKPLSKVNNSSPDHLSGLSKDLVGLRKGLVETRLGLQQLATASPLPAADQQAYAAVRNGLTTSIRSLPTVAENSKPITVGIGEPFTTTITVVLYFSVLVSLPMILYQIYAFVIPALSPKEARVAKPVMIIAPLLFVAGVAFTYFLVLPPAVEFLQGYNSKQFDSLLQAAPYYKFEILTMAGIGVAFQVPLLMLALQRAGIVDGSTLTGNWRYAILIISVIVAILPGVDPVTMFFEMLPMVLLYLASIVLLKLADRRDARKARQDIIRAGHASDHP
jgi:sec-independent protein translocase protein TatC